MKNKIFAFLTALIIAGFLFGCRQDNGYIGRLYGIWRVDSYTKDGEVQSNEKISSTTISFQNKTVMISCVIDNHYTFDPRYGTWDEEGDELTLNFTHHDNYEGAQRDIYVAPGWLGMTSTEPMIMVESDNKNNSFTLTWLSPVDGSVNVYRLSKTF